MQSQNSNLFGEYIQGKGVKLSDVPINPNVEFHFILAFAIDYTTSGTPSSTDGIFNIFWDSNILSPDHVSSIRNANSNVKVALTLKGDRVRESLVYFSPSSKELWLRNAVSSLTSIIKRYHLDGIDIDYEHFKADADPDIFAECIGQLITTLKNNKVISFASIAPFDDHQVQQHYLALWKKYGQQIDYVNFQFYKYPKITEIQKFLDYFKTQSTKYDGANVLVSFISDGSDGLSPANGFFNACSTLQNQQELYGIFVWSADLSMKNGFIYEIDAQKLLADASH